MTKSPLFPIATIERETGLSKDVLRKWETRYGFPVPLRDAKGERLYPEEQLARLRLIKRLMDAGFRPAEIVSAAPEVLRSMSTQHPCARSGSIAGPVSDLIIDLLSEHNIERLRKTLRGYITRHGLHVFVLDIMPDLNCAVGDAWARGDLQVFEEHLYTDVIQGVVRQAVGDVASHHGRPRVLLTTVPGELHVLGILMAEAVLSLHGCRCINLGAQTPFAEIPSAVAAYEIDVVGLSFSVAFPSRRIAPALAELRRLLPGSTAVWAGGGGIARLRQLPDGIRGMTTLTDAVAELASFQDRAAD